MEKRPILQINNLKTSFFTDDGEIPAVDDISLDIYPSEIVGIVGESGCGKSVTSLSVMGLVPPPGKIVSGSILLDGEDVVQASEKRMRQIRGNELAMIFQEPMTSLNPVFTIGTQLLEAVHIHKRLPKKEAFRRAVEMLKLVGLARAEELMSAFPHQLSGGMRQRVMIAMALICDPKILIADEPTTALDVTIQAQILHLMRELNQNLQMAILLITHDLGVIAKLCQRVVVMYAGKIVEEGLVHDIFSQPKHPYTQGLLLSIPDIRRKEKRLYSIPGQVPRPGSIRKGCRFFQRCTAKLERCREHDPPYLTMHNNHHAVRCWLYAEEGRLADEPYISPS